MVRKKQVLPTGDKIYIDDKDHIVIPPGINSAMLKNQLVRLVKMSSKSSKWKKLYNDTSDYSFPGTMAKPPKDSTEPPMVDFNYLEQVDPTDQFPHVLRDVMSLLAEDSGTSIPYIANVTGSFLVNPCPVSMSTFSKMWQTDETVNRCVTQNINTIIQGIGDYHHDIPECQKIGRLAIQHLNDGLSGFVESVTGASIVNGMYAGFIDKQYIERTKEGYSFPGMIRHMPELSVQFTADYKGSINNVYQYVYNYPYAGTQNALSIGAFGMYGLQENTTAGLGVFSIDQMASLGPMDYPFRTNFISNFGLVQLDKRYVIHYANQSAAFGINPYGYSWLLPIYNLWIMKQLSRELYISAQSRVAHPMLVGYASHTAKIQVGPSPQEVVGAIDALYQALSTHTEDSALILTGLKGQVMQVEAIHPEADFSVFENALKYYDERIEVGLKSPSDVGSEKESYAGLTAQGSIYTNNMGKYRKDIVQRVVLNQYMRYVLQTNYDKNIMDLGEFSLCRF